MKVELNHTIVWCSNKACSTEFLTHILGLPTAVPFLHFLVVKLDNGISLDYYEKAGPIAKQHYAFLVSESDFDRVFQRVAGGGLTYWADPAKTRPQEINRHDGGRGFYFEDPDGHLLEVITKSYGSDYRHMPTST